MGGEFLELTKRTLAKRAGEKCSICSKSTSKPHASDLNAFINLGEAAHIRGNKDGKHLRFDKKMKDEERSHISNAIWLCQPCHKEIDSDSIKYTVDILNDIKLKHENRVYLGEFDVTWSEKIRLEEKIEILETLITEKGKNQVLQESVYNVEINKLRVDLEKVINEKEKFEISINTLTATLSGLDFQNPSENTKLILEAYKNGNLNLLKELLNDEILDKEEKQIAQKRLLKANLFEIENEYINAENCYQRAYELAPTKYFLENYIAFLKRNGKINKAIEVCLAKGSQPIENSFKIWINGAIGELFCGKNENKNGISYILKALEIVNNEIGDNPERSKLDKAQMLFSLGIAYKQLGEFDQALSYFNDSLNEFWNMTIKDGVTHVRELGLLFNSIGLLYLKAGNDPTEALKYFEKACIAFQDEEVNDELFLAIAYLNMVDVFAHPLKKDMNESRRYIDLAMNLLSSGFLERPLVYLEYYIGILIKSADHYLIDGKLNGAEVTYEKAIQISNDFSQSHGISYSSERSVLYSNYAVCLGMLGKMDQAIEYNKNAIDILSLFDDAEHEKHFGLAKLYMLRAELKEERDHKVECFEKANLHIGKCKESTMVNGLKLKIKQTIENYT